MEGFGGFALGDLLTGVALAAVFEGTLYALFPGVTRRGAETVLKTPVPLLRLGGLGMAAAGVFCVWLIRSS